MFTKNSGPNIKKAVYNLDKIGGKITLDGYHEENPINY